MPVLAYHMVTPQFDWGVTRVTPKQFDKQIRFAVENGFRFVTAAESVADLHSGANDKTVAVTFDDGYESVFTYAFPVMKKYNVPATVFVIADYAGQFNKWDVNFGCLRFRHMSWKQVVEVHRNGWEIGSHGLAHRDLTRLPEKELEKELSASRALIEKRIKANVHSISYPFGNVNKAVTLAARKSGYKQGFVMSREGESDDMNLYISRLGIYMYDNTFTFGQKLCGKNKGMYKLGQRILDFCSNGTVIVKQGRRGCE